MIDHFHTALRPLDSCGNSIKPLDIVLINSVPEHYWKDPELAHLERFSGAYGMVIYPCDGVEFQPHYLGNKDHPGWVSPDGGVVHVLARKIIGPEVVSWDFWIPPKNITKMPFNSLLLNIFSEYPWQMQKVGEPGSVLFIREGLEEFDYLKEIMEAPLSVLEEAHDAAMRTLRKRRDA